MSIRHLALVLAIASSGCLLVNGDDDDCQYGGAPAGEGAAVYDPGVRNPETGLCEYYGGGGGGSCDACGNCPDVPTDDRAPTPTWGSCESGCEGLDQATCEATSACRAIFADGDVPTFAACWPTDTTGPVQGGGCEGLDAFTCSLHDDCSAVHSSTTTPDGLVAAIGGFVYCTPEGGGGGGVGTCDGVLTCEQAGPACPEGTTPGVNDGGCYTGYCIPLEDCGDGAPDPGTCYGPVTGDGPTPACPAGTQPGRSNGFYTGYCIPDEYCEEAPACAETIGEASCVARADCTPIYQGQDCTCEGDVCDCADWVFDHCE